MRHIGKTGAGWGRRLGVTAALLPFAMGATMTVVSTSTVSTSTVATAASGWASSLWLGGGTASVGTTLKDVRTIIGADTGAAASLTGLGVGIALIDTGVAPVPGLPAAQIVNGPDLSFESQSANLRYLDTYGHGTHMAGIMVGNDTATGTKGIAPKAKLTSIKVGTSNGAVDVSQMIAAIDWVVAHRNDDPANPIRVINLSYGTGVQQEYWTDPVHFAVEQAWLNGIVVVVAVGNDGNDYGYLTNPSSDPYVIGVGAASTKGTVATSDDYLSTFTNVPWGNKPIDVMAPGESIVSLRDPLSNIDNAFPGARVGETLFRGSGTSQAAAVTSAAVALILQAKPSLNPDQVKSALKEGTWIPNGIAAAKGLKLINVNTVLARTVSTVAQTFTKSNGTGLLEASRGSSHVVSASASLSGEKSIFGPFSSTAWAQKSASRTSWVGGLWMGFRVAGNGWTGSSWASKTWASATWSGTSWDGGSWIDPNWSGRFWSGRFWSNGAWVGRFWSSDDWSTASWS